jgi:hypothetical protein
MPPRGRHLTTGNGTTLRIMPTTATLLALALVATTVAGCQDDAATQAAAAPPSAVAAAGNGVAALSADEILKRSKDALKKAKSFQAKGVMVDEGGKNDVDLHVDGDEFAGTMATGAAKLEMVAVGGKNYMKPNEQFFTMVTDPQQGKALATKANGHWIAGEAGDAALGDLFTIGSVDGLLKPSGAVSKGAEKEIAGVPAIALNDAGDTDTVLWIATTGEPYPLQIANKSGDTLVFSAIGEPATGITAPPAAETIASATLFGK